VPRVSSFELPISASHIHLLRVLPLVGCRSKTPTGLPLTYPLKYNDLMCRFLASLSKVACLANTSCAINPSCSSSLMSGDASYCTTWLAGAMNLFGKKYTMHVGAGRPDPSGLSFGRHTCFLSIPACFNSWFLKRGTLLFWLLLKPGGHHCPSCQMYSH
jgi:hypothetical protein